MEERRFLNSALCSRLGLYQHWSPDTEREDGHRRTWGSEVERRGACRTISVFLVLAFQLSVLVSIISGPPRASLPLPPKKFFHFVKPTPGKWIYTFVCFPVQSFSFSSHCLGLWRPVWWGGWRWSGGFSLPFCPGWFVCLVSTVSLILLL